MHLTGFLVLEDEKVFEGTWHGNSDWTGVGEVVFNTSLVGYQEVITDPSYYQQIIVMTAPEQGNYGVSDNERESKKVWCEAFVCLELNRSSDARRGNLEDELSSFKRPALSSIDTRSLTLYLRTRGTPWGAAVRADSAEEAKRLALPLIAEHKRKVSSDWVYDITVKKSEFFPGQKDKGRIAILDYGVKSNIVGELRKRSAQIAVFGSRTPAHEVLDWSPDGIVLTNGPGDPAAVQVAVGELSKLLGQKPIMGICMGHQLLARALGGKTFKLKFGHRGSNHPVKNLKTGEIYMTAQNHGYAVDKDLPSGVNVSQINLYDNTVEGIEAPALNAWSVQYHPEAGPGPHDSRVLFDHFISEVVR
ncbi:MAG: glutamine-hydrolyzing carbamoyl-phosphate synthase small subunit [Oligoflexia bacterium]|nr:glutamine-hydrolyzing carbamoyl-phosphate synthase small subunit [Oligoflexia bacterium]